MKYSEIIKILKEENLLLHEEISYDMFFSYISYNSLDVKDNTLFFCKGFNFKEKYLEDAISKGATCYVSEAAFENIDIPVILVKDIRRAVALIGKAFYKNEEEILKIGITGTKGKTTTVYFLHNIFDVYENSKTAYISTIDYYTGKSSNKSHNTTPDSLELLRMFDEMYESDKKRVVMEVSSQAYKLDRIYGLEFEIGGFLNIGLDHIAPHEHANYEEYLDCKLGFLKKCKKVFLYEGLDNFSYIKEELKDKKITIFGFTDKSDYIIKNIVKEKGYTSFEILHEGKLEKYALTMAGKFNCINACCAIAIAKELGIDYESIYKGLYNTKVPGRMNIFEDFICPVIVDYAHNKLSIENLFNSIREDYPNSNLKVVVGCPGEKAFNRRKEVADLCGEYASFVYLTAEDPASKKVEDICDEIISYLEPYNIPYDVTVDRELAILKAMDNAKKDDIIAIIGKGDEDYQLIGTNYAYYKSDIKVVEERISKITN